MIFLRSRSRPCVWPTSGPRDVSPEASTALWFGPRAVGGGGPGPYFEPPVVLRKELSEFIFR